MSVLRRAKLRTPDGTESIEYPLGVEAENVEVANGENLSQRLARIDEDLEKNEEDIAAVNELAGRNKQNIGANEIRIDALERRNASVDKKPYYFDTIADMKAYQELKAGDMAITLGYYTANDGGAKLYKIVDDNSLVDDGGSVIDLENGLKAELIKLDDYIIIDKLTLADKYLFLFRNDFNFWKVAGERINNNSYSEGEFIKDKNSNNIYICTKSGESGNTYPNFNEEVINDGDVVWKFVSVPIEWKENTHYSVNDSVNIMNLSYVCIKEHLSSIQDGYNIKVRNNVLYKRVNNNTESNYPSLTMTLAYDNTHKIKSQGRNICTSAIEVSNDGKTFNIIDTPMNFLGQDFSPIFYKGKYYVITFDKQRYNDFSIYVTQNFKDFIKTEIKLGISTPEAEHVWFGQWFKDSITDKLYITFSAQDKNKPFVTYNGNQYINFRLWKVEVLDLENFVFGEPTLINLSDNNRFDVFIITKEQTYYLFTRRYVDEGDGSHEGFVEIWFSNDLENWSLSTQRISVLNDSGYEAISVIEYEKNKYYLYASRNVNYDYSRMYRIESNDLINWSNKIALPPTTLNLNEFGTVIKVDNQEALSYLYNYMTINNNSRNLIRPTNYLNLESTKTLVWRHLNYTTHTLNVVSCEDVIYTTNVNVSDIIISNIASNDIIPHRFFLRTTNVGTNYIKIKSDGNIYLPNNLTEINLYGEMIAEFVWDSSIEKYILVSPTLDFIRKSNARLINLNTLAQNNVIENLEIEPNCIYQVDINTKLTVNKTSFKYNFNGEFQIAFVLYGNGSNHTTELTLKNTAGNVIVTQYGTSADLVLNSTNNSNKYIPFKRLFGTGSLRLWNI